MISLANIIQVVTFSSRNCKGLEYGELRMAMVFRCIWSVLCRFSLSCRIQFQIPDSCILRIVTVYWGKSFLYLNLTHCMPPETLFVHDYMITCIGLERRN